MTTTAAIVAEATKSGDLSAAIRRVDALSKGPFGLGWFHGNATGLPCSAREAAEYLAETVPEWGSEEIALYLNGRDDGVRGDRFRLDGGRP